MRSLIRALVMLVLLVNGMLVMDLEDADAIAPPRSAAWCTSQTNKNLNCGSQGQPYAESICNTDPNILFCEDFNYPVNLTCHNGYYASDDALEWYNPGMSQPHNGVMDRSYGSFQRMDCRALDWPATSSFQTQPSGSPAGGNLLRSRPGIEQGSSTINMCLMGDCNPSTADALENYPNGTAPSNNIHIRFQMYTSGPNDGTGANWHFPSDYDTKTFFLYPNQYTAKTDANYDGGLIVNAFGRCANPVRIPDALSFRQGPCCTGFTNTTYPNYPAFTNMPVYQGHSLNSHNEYCTGTGAPNGTSGDGTTAVPMDNIPPAPSGLQPATAKRTPDPGTLYRMAAGYWYTIEFEYILGTPGVENGRISLWVDGVKVYGDSDLLTCSNASGEGDCSAIREFFFEIAWYNGITNTSAGVTEAQLVTQYSPNSYRLIDNYIISTAYIGVPGGGGGGGTPPAAPTNLRVARALLEPKLDRPGAQARLEWEDWNPELTYVLYKNGQYESIVPRARYVDRQVEPGPLGYELRAYRGDRWVGVDHIRLR